MNKRSLVFIWDNFGPTHVDRVDAVASAIPDVPVVGIELARSSNDYDWISESGDRFHKVNLPQERGAWPVVAMRIIRALLAARPAFVFTCHYERPEIFAAVLIVRLLGVPVFVMTDSKFDDYPRILWREVLKRLFFLPYMGAIVGSRRTAEYLSFLAFQPNQLFAGYDAISVARIRLLSGSSPAPGGAPFRERHFTIVARLVRKKNISTALRAFACLHDEGCQRRLVICGSGVLETQLKAEADALGISASVSFEGFVQTDRVAVVLGSTLALIQASVEEQFGIAIAEAVAMGVPVLAAETCGARDTLVRTAVNGFVFEPDNIDGLAAHMRALDTDEDLWRRLSLGCESFAARADTGVFVDSVRRLCGMAQPALFEALAPIAIFAFRRPAHLERCLDALEQCPEFAQSQVFVYVDGPRDGADADGVAAVFALLERRIRPNMTVIRREKNRGLAASIIAEVTTLVERHGRIIVIEDDLVVQPTALTWLNHGLEAFRDDLRVMQISAFQYYVSEFADRNVGNFQRFTTTWGWATWKRAWDIFDPTAAGWEKIAAPGPARTAFDSGGIYPFSDMLVKQMSGELDSWGIRWSWAMHKAEGLTLMPPRSLVRNDGLNETATHNSVGWLKRFVSGPRPLVWGGETAPLVPDVARVELAEQRAFTRGLKRTNALRNAWIKSILSIIGLQVSSARIALRMQRVIAVAQLPPPTNGLSTVSEKMVEALKRADLLFEATDVSPSSGRTGLAKVIERVTKTVKAGTLLLRPLYRRAATVYLPCDGGMGGVYNLAVVALSRPGQFALWLHHHSFAYINRRSSLMATILRVCPQGTNHIFLCQAMADLFRTIYRSEWEAGKHQSHILSNAFTVNPRPLVRRTSGELVIGHLSNLTVEKGSLRFIALFRRLAEAGVAIRAEMAGPTHDKATMVAIEEAVANYPDTFKWRGPLSGDAKDAFYNALDVFVFPTSYRNEAQPLVILEALAHGAVILSIDRGCIACDHAGGLGLVVKDDGFDEAAYDWLTAISATDRRKLPKAARAAFEAARQISNAQLDTVLGLMAASTSRSTEQRPDRRAFPPTRRQGPT